jgi:hypothetical protein
MPYLFKGECLTTPADALELFRSQYPQQQAAVVYQLTASSVSPTGLITFSTRTSANAASITNGTVQLTSCVETPPTVGIQFQQLATVLLIVFFTAFFLRKAIRFFSRFLGGFSSDL